MEARESGRVSPDLGNSANLDPVEAVSGAATAEPTGNETSGGPNSCHDSVPFATRNGESRGSIGFDHRSNVFHDWHKRAAVRNQPPWLVNERELREDLEQGRNVFPLDLAPISQHRLMQELGPRAVREQITHELYRYNSFTEELEDIVQAIANAAKNNKLGHLSADLRDRARTVTADETFHTIMTCELQDAVHRCTGVAPIDPGKPLFLKRLDFLRSTVEPEYRLLVDFGFTTVSETLITSTLSQIPNDKTVVRWVRETMLIHRHDEGNHHAYFSDAFTDVWRRLSQREKAMLGPMLPQFIIAFMEPDREAVMAGLAGYKLSPVQLRTVIEESLTSERIVTNAKGAASATMALFRRLSILDDPRIAEAFYAAGLL